MNAVIVKAKRQSGIVQNLVDYIEQLDGTKVVVIDAIDETDRYPDRNNFAFHQAVVEMAGETFFWLEPDSIPIKKNWLQTIEKEYLESWKQFMLSSDKNPPHDLIGGIGVYGPRTKEIIPKHIEGGHGWDGWMIRNVPHLIHRTPIIQHSYGFYDPSGYAISHRFPRDIDMIRENSVIFHRDKYQDLIGIVNRQQIKCD
jgi:hypothetical protein